MSSPPLQLRLIGIRYKAEGVLEFELQDPSGAALPPHTCGAHIDLHLAGGLVRSYSLCNATADTHRYIVAVGLDAKSRGGSKYLHETVRVGSPIAVTAPRNTFPLVEDARHSLLIAGGIGVTPLWSMAQRLTELGRSWEIFYAARSRRTAAYVQELEALALRSGGKVHLHFDDVEGRAADLAPVFARVDPRTHAYCCGPAPMIEAFRAAAQARLPDEQVHIEFFKAADPVQRTGDAFSVCLNRSGRVLPVGSEQSILDVLLDAGVDIPYSCMEGICGSCQLNVVEGIPDHRDSVLSNRQRAANDVVIACCSRSKSELLVLDV
ncbi:PDR/VanB family oxidoreductase [Variovorax sp. RA8]|uniref:PDR/VanB family oxidoreductase n=1 Tax=Variovorax sp. (strain JCM 16519 / RA8) TaxID=662548 RepID=UPI0013161869|nr:PDR/VanB family oxidoreductase [Variovorax sp. RA8]VTU41586.1 Phenoxybenzoate dioxygenase subunit beta [Variovorax sp. RA8]